MVVSMQIPSLSSCSMNGGQLGQQDMFFCFGFDLGDLRGVFFCSWSLIRSGEKDSISIMDAQSRFQKRKVSCKP